MEDADSLKLLQNFDKLDEMHLSNKLIELPLGPYSAKMIPLKHLLVTQNLTGIMCIK